MWKSDSGFVENVIAFMVMTEVINKKEKKIPLFSRVPESRKIMVDDLKTALPPVEQRPRGGVRQFRTPSGSEVVSEAIVSLHKKHFGSKK